MRTTEFEIKHIGRYGALKSLADTFNQKVNSVLDRTYHFITEYLDTPTRDFENAGFSMRYRPAANYYNESFELKAIGGDVDGISARLEIEGRGEPTKDNNYAKLLNHPYWPENAPKPKLEDMELLFSTGVTRREIQADLELSSGRALIEFCFDDIAYYNKHGEPCGFENETELEIKKVFQLGQERPATAQDIKEVMAWYQEFECLQQADLVMHTISKADRARRYVNG